MLTALLASALCATPQGPSFPPFPPIPGWSLGGLETYDEKSLFEYIDGAAGAFIQLDFLVLRTATYTSAAKVDVTVDVYQHKDAFSAFGMYAQERPKTYTPLPIGTEGLAVADHLEFVVGPYYVKMTQSTGGATALRSIAERVASVLPGPRAPPPVLSCFPEKGRLARRERVAVREFFGHSFLHRGYTAPYDLDGVKFRLFVIEGDDAADARKMLEQYLALAKLPPVSQAEGRTTLADPLQGTTSLAWRGRWLWGAVEGNAPPTELDELGRCLGSLQRR